MQDGSRFIENHSTTSYHPHISDGTANSVIGIMSRLDGHTAGTAHLMITSRTNGLMFIGTLTRYMDGVPECLWIVERVKLGETKLGMRPYKEASRTP
jgi:hypothetical protein